MKQYPDFLALGHVTRDVQADGSFSLGGTVTFATLTAHQLGLPAGIVTCADAEVAARLAQELPEVALHVRPVGQSTTFANQYHGGFRTQYLYARAADLTLEDIPAEWLTAGVVLFGPLAQELRSELITCFPRRAGQLLAATPQGWLRRWDADGRVWPKLWLEAEEVLSALDVLILSHDDLLPFAADDRAAADALLLRWSQSVPVLVATDGRHGATLFEHGKPRRFPAYPAQEVDPTGAGDVFAAAFLTYLYRHGDAVQAVDFANCVASFSIEQPGIRGIPTLTQVAQRQQAQHSRYPEP